MARKVILVGVNFQERYVTYHCLDPPTPSFLVTLCNEFSLHPATRLRYAFNEWPPRSNGSLINFSSCLALYYRVYCLNSYCIQKVWWKIVLNQALKFSGVQLNQASTKLCWHSCVFVGKTHSYFKYFSNKRIEVA